MATIDIFNVVKITKSDIYTGAPFMKCRTIKIITKKGEEIEINCWSDKFTNLIIKDEK